MGGDRITRPVDNGRMTVIQGNLHPPRKLASIREWWGRNGAPLRYAAAAADPSLPAFLVEQSTPGSPNYRK